MPRIRRFSISRWSNETVKKTVFHFFYAVTIIWGVATLLFAMFSLAGDPVKMLLGPRADQATELAIRKKIGYDRPAHERYLRYLYRLLPLRTQEGRWGVYPPDLGESFRYRRPVWDLYLEKLPGTMILALVSLAIGAAGGILMGVTAARHEGRATDTFITVVASVGFSVPSYFAAVACIWFFTVAFDFGLRPTGYILDDNVFEPGVSLQLKNLILPVLTLAVRPLGTITLITRERMCHALRQPYILAARAHGLPYGRIVWIFALKNAAIPLAASLSGWLAALLTGAFFIEFLFDWQGVGRLLVDGLLNNDFPLVSGCCLATATLFIFINMLTDRFYLWADPVQRK